jgi:hypothetical protein
VNKQVQKLLQEGIIEESESPWNTLILVVPEKADVVDNKNSGLWLIIEN